MRQQIHITTLQFYADFLCTGSALVPVVHPSAQNKTKPREKTGFISAIIIINSVTACDVSEVVAS